MGCQQRQRPGGGWCPRSSAPRPLFPLFRARGFLKTFLPPNTPPPPSPKYKQTVPPQALLPIFPESQRLSKYQASLILVSSRSPCQVVCGGGASLATRWRARASQSPAPSPRPLSLPSASQRRSSRAPDLPRRDNGGRASQGPGCRRAPASVRPAREGRLAATAPDPGSSSSCRARPPPASPLPTPPRLHSANPRLPLQPRSGGGRSQGDGRSAACRPRRAFGQQRRRCRGVRRALARRGEPRSRGLQPGRGGTAHAGVCRSVGGDSLELGRRRGQGERGGAPSSAPPSPPSQRSSRGASASAPLTMDLRGVGTRLGSRAREAARPRGCAGARAGMAR